MGIVRNGTSPCSGEVVEMVDTTPRARDWAWLGIVSFVIWAVSAAHEFPLGQGIAAVLFFWALVNFVHHAGVIAADIIKEIRPETYKYTPNYTAELIKSMNKDQLKAWGRIGNARVSVLVRKGKNSLPLYMLHGEDVSLDFLNHYLNTSTEHRVCPVSNFMAETHHWDWSQDNIISDYEQACACRAYLVRNGWAEWMGNGNAPTWAMSLDGNRWKPEDVRRIHGLTDDDEMEGEA